ncbi:MAG TPA: ABC transporter permease [Candidatus Methylacidiphilales bacterium]|nr:ABC transporter permease [Candidatus Methylacidiphilales bacterium]
MNLPVELFLAVRYIRPQRNFVSLITVISILGVTLAVAVLILVLSVMSGFRKELTDKLTEFNAHITVMRDGYLEDPAPLVKEVLREKDVLAATPFVVGPVLAKFKGRVSTPTIKGIPAEADDPVMPIKRYIRQEREGMRQGEFELRGDTVMVGDEWARLNGANVGDIVTIIAPNSVINSKAFKDAIGPEQPPGTGSTATNAPGKPGTGPGGASAPQDPLPQQDEQETQTFPTDMEITAIFSTGYYPIDSGFFIVSLENGQRFYQLNQGAHGIAVKVKDPVEAKRTADSLMAHWKNTSPPLRARTWLEQNKSLVGAVATERVVMAMILFVVMVVAAFGLCSTLITVTVQKSGEIGILKAMGANDIQVGSIFALYGLVVGIAGSTAGVTAGLYCLHVRNDFLGLLSYRFGIEAFPKDIYGFTSIPAIVEPEFVVLVVVAAILTCVVAALLPAMRAALIDPVKALRHE